MRYQSPYPPLYLLALYGLIADWGFDNLTETNLQASRDSHCGDGISRLCSSMSMARRCPLQSLRRLPTDYILHSTSARPRVCCGPNRSLLHAWASSGKHANIAIAIKKVPFKIQEEGWGEFDMEIVLSAIDKGGDHALAHDLNFQTERYEAKHPVVSSSHSQASLKETTLILLMSDLQKPQARSSSSTQRIRPYVWRGERRKAKARRRIWEEEEET